MVLVSLQVMISSMLVGPSSTTCLPAPYYTPPALRLLQAINSLPAEVLTARDLQSHSTYLLVRRSQSTNIVSACLCCSEKWVAQFEKAASSISGGDGSKSASSVLQAIQSLGSSAKGGNLQDAKQKYITAVTALQSWIGSSGIDGIRGL